MHASSGKPGIPYKGITFFPTQIFFLKLIFNEIR